MTTYVCPNCGCRTLGKGGKPWPCSACGATCEPPDRPPNQDRDGVAEMLGRWFARIDPEDLERQAEQGAPLTRSLFKTVKPMQIYAARGFLGSGGMDYVRGVDDAECEAVIDAMFSFAPDQASVFWQHIDWARRELMVAKQILVS